MYKTPLKHLIYWGIGGAAAPAFSLLFYAGMSGALLMAVFTAPSAVLWGVIAGLFTHYTWNTGARFVACLLGMVAGFLSSLELLMGLFSGPIGLSGALLLPLGLRYPSVFVLIGGITIAGLLYQAALLTVLLVLRQLFRWANGLVAMINRKG